MKYIQLFEQFVSEAATPKEISIDVLAYTEIGGGAYRYFRFEINGRKSGKKVENTNKPQQAAQFVEYLTDDLLKKMKLKNVSPKDFKDWFENKFDFPLEKVNSLKIKGLEGDLDSFEGTANQWD